MKESNIKLDIGTAYSIAAASAVRRSLEQTHGGEFANAFFEDHQDAFRRAVRTSLCSREETNIHRTVALLKQSYRG